MTDTQEVQQRGGELGRSHAITGGIGPAGVAGSIDLAPVEPRPRHHKAEHITPVVAATAAVEFRCPAHFAHGDDEGRIQQPPRGQVLDQGGETLIELRTEHIFHPRVVVGVGVPEGVGSAQIAGLARPVHKHHPHARLNQPAGQQHRLCPFPRAISCAGGGGFGIEGERPSGGARADQVESLAPQTLVITRHRRLSPQRAPQLFQQLLAEGHPRPAQLLGQGQAVNSEVGGGGIAAKDFRIPPASQKATILAGQEDVWVRDDRLGEHHRGERSPFGRLKHPHDGAERRPVGRGEGPHVGPRVFVPGVDPIAPRLVVRIIGGERPDDGQLVGDRRSPRQQLAKRQPGHTRGDGGEDPANLRRGLGLGVEGLVLRWPATEIEVDEALRPSERAPCLPSVRLVGSPGRGRRDEWAQIRSQPRPGSRLSQSPTGEGSRRLLHARDPRVPRNSASIVANLGPVDCPACWAPHRFARANRPLTASHRLGFAESCSRSPFPASFQTAPTHLPPL